MKKTILTITMLTALFLTSCKDNPNKNNAENATTETVENTSDDIITSTSTSKDGKVLDMTYNNTKGTATLNFNGETIELNQEKAGSGIWYKNDTYELRGKGNDMTLTKDGNVVFEHNDDVVNTEVKNKKGDILNLTFNNTEGTVKAYLNGGKQIDLTQEKAASGIWYKNDQYELRGKGNDITLKKDGNVIFEHHEDVVNIDAKNDNNDILNMTFNNTEGTVKAYFNGGEQIDLVQENAASGIWYKNEHFELSGKGNSYTLSKDGDIIFTN